MKIALYETDIEGDFALRTGALFVKGLNEETPWPYGAEAKLPNIYTLHKHAAKNNWLITGSVDRHFYEDVELIRNQGGVFQDHCMNGTAGQLRLAGLEPQRDIYIRAKDGPRMGIRVYTEAELQEYLDSGMQIIFEKQSYNVNTNPNFRPALKLMFKKKKVNKMVFNGFATDYCLKAAVLETAEAAKEFNEELELYVVTDAIEEVDINFQGQVDPDFGKKALEEMVAAGARLITTKDVLEGKVFTR